MYNCIKYWINMNPAKCTVLCIDLLQTITDCIEDSAAWQSWRLVCSITHRCSQPRHYLFTNQLLNILQETWEDHNWNWKAIAKNPNITYAALNTIPFAQWNTCDMVKNVTFPTDVIPLIYRSINWSALSANRAITMEFITSHRYLPWDWGYVSSNPNLTIFFVASLPTYVWDWEAVSRNPGITMADIDNYPELPWNKNYMLMNSRPDRCS